MKKIYNNSGAICKFIPCINKGTYGRIYRINDELCVKLFELGSAKLYEVDPDVLCTIKNLNPRNFYEINDLLYDDNGKLIGYVMQYYEKEDIDLLSMPVETIIKIVRGLYSATRKLSDSKITIRDMRQYNIIINQNNIIVIDVDAYFSDKKISKKELLCDNVRRLYKMLEELFYQAFTTYYRDMDEEFYDFIADLCGTIDEDKSIKAFCDILKGHGSIIEYVKNKAK